MMGRYCGTCRHTFELKRNDWSVVPGAETTAAYERALAESPEYLKVITEGQPLIEFLAWLRKSHNIVLPNTVVHDYLDVPSGAVADQKRRLFGVAYGRRRGL